MTKSLVNAKKVKGLRGISGSCYCCGSQLYVEFSKLDILPTTLIEGSLYYVLICDSCERDIRMLKDEGISEISYDHLWEALGEMTYALARLEGEGHEDITLDERDALLHALYLDIETEKTTNNLKDIFYGKDNKTH